MDNLFDDIPTTLDTELTERIAGSDSVRIERIVSQGHVTSDSTWYDQTENEFVAVLQGTATIQFGDGSTVEMEPGSWIDIPARRKHRVTATSTDPKTIWLAVFYSMILITTFCVSQFMTAGPLAAQDKDLVDLLPVLDSAAEAILEIEDGEQTLQATQVLMEQYFRSGFLEEGLAFAEQTPRSRYVVLRGVAKIGMHYAVAKQRDEANEVIKLIYQLEQDGANDFVYHSSDIVSCQKPCWRKNLIMKIPSIGPSRSRKFLPKFEWKR